MAYNYFPMNYPYYIPQFTQDTQTGGGAQGSQSRPQTSTIWVQGEAGAKAYPVAPGTTVQLWDSEAQTIFLKSADASGMPSMKVLDYTIRESQTPGTSRKADDEMSRYVTREEFERRLIEISRRPADE